MPLPPTPLSISVCWRLVNSPRCPGPWLKTVVIVKYWLWSRYFRGDSEGRLHSCGCLGSAREPENVNCCCFVFCGKIDVSKQNGDLGWSWDFISASWGHLEVCFSFFRVLLGSLGPDLDLHGGTRAMERGAAGSLGEFFPWAKLLGTGKCD